MDSERVQLLRSGFDLYLKCLDSPLEPDDPHLPYDYASIVQAKWSMQADVMIPDELREVTNQLHQWRGSLRRWHAWNQVVLKYEETQAWELRVEFMEPLVHYCLTRPSSFRDIITFVATNAFHQVRLHTESDYADFMEGDASPSEPAPRPLTRRKKEHRLAKLSAPLVGSKEFIKSFRKIDDEGYRNQTSDYRNLNSHAIGPRIALGITRAITRKVVPATDMVRSSNGTCSMVPSSDRYAASYSFGGTKPLDLESARLSNLEQYRRARACFAIFTKLLTMYSAGLSRT